MNHLVIYVFILLCCLSGTPLAAQRTGFQLSINRIGLDNTTENVIKSTDTASLFYPVYKRQTRNFGLTAGVTYRTDKCIFTVKSGYFQNRFSNTEKEASPATYAITEIKNENSGIYWGLEVSKTFYFGKRLFLNYGIGLNGTIGIRDYLSIYTNYFDRNADFLATSNTNQSLPRTNTVSLAPLGSLNYFIYRHISLGIEYQYGLEFTSLNGPITYRRLATDNAGVVLLERSLDVTYKYKNSSLHRRSPLISTTT